MPTIIRQYTGKEREPSRSSEGNPKPKRRGTLEENAMLSYVQAWGKDPMNMLTAHIKAISYAAVAVSLMILDARDASKPPKLG